MTFAPPTLVALAEYWTGHGGVNLGIVGDARHIEQAGSYHLGRDQLGAGAYSAKTTRDRAGLSNAASAIDLGKLNGSYTGLRAFSVWLVARARANEPGTSDMREIIYSPDGKTVLRWDRERGVASVPRSGEASDSHLFHTHVSWYRDAEFRDHKTAFLPYWGDDIVIPAKTDGPFNVTIPAGTQRYDERLQPVSKTTTPINVVDGYFLTGTGFVAIATTPGGAPRQLMFVKTAAAGVKVVAKPPPIVQPDPAALKTAKTAGFTEAKAKAEAAVAAITE